MPPLAQPLPTFAGTRKGFIVKASGYILLLLLFVAALPLAAQVNDTYVIPVVANTPGSFGTQWMTQLSIFNPQLDYSLKVSVSYLPTGGGQGLEALITVPANGVAFVDNSLDEIFHRSGSGAYVIATFPEDNPGVPNDVISRAFLVNTNTFNKLSNGGTMGQTIPGTWAGLQDYATDQISAISHGLRQLSAFGWRTNFGAVNLGSTPATLRIRVYDRNGNTLVKDRTYTVPAQGHMQTGLPVEVDQGSIEFFVDDATKKAVVFPYTSTLDRYTNDPMYQTPVLLASAKTLFGKRAVDLTALGHKLTLDDARAVRANTIPLGEVTLK
jgi:hypothetical protein